MNNDVLLVVAVLYERWTIAREGRVALPGRR